MFGLNNYERDYHCCFFLLPAQWVEIKKEIAMLKTNYFSRLTKSVGSLRNISALKKRQEGKMGYILLWLLGVPIPILFFIYLLRGCD
ncbi:MAG: hypothetical protein IPH22_04230 [Nitrosomonas sp.]|nr:hypothetical protein [Nitrosomonas sp.]